MLFILIYRQKIYKVEFIFYQSSQRVSYFCFSENDKKTYTNEKNSDYHSVSTDLF